MKKETERNENPKKTSKVILYVKQACATTNHTPGCSKKMSLRFVQRSSCCARRCRLAQAVTPVVFTGSGVARKITVLRRVGDKGVMDVRIEDWEEYGAV